MHEVFIRANVHFQAHSDAVLSGVYIKLAAGRGKREQLVVTECVACTPLVASTFLLGLSASCRCLTETTYPTTTVGKILIQKLRCFKEAATTEVLWVLECQKEVCMSDQNASQLLDKTASRDEVEGSQYPRQVHSLKRGAEEKCDDHVTVELRPNVQYAHYHWAHEKEQRYEKSSDDKKEPTEN